MFKPIHTVFTQQTEMNGKHIYSTKTKRKTQKQTKTGLEPDLHKRRRRPQSGGSSVGRSWYSWRCSLRLRCRPRRPGGLSQRQARIYLQRLPSHLQYSTQVQSYIGHIMKDIGYRHMVRCMKQREMQQISTTDPIFFIEKKAALGLTRNTPVLVHGIGHIIALAMI